MAYRPENPVTLHLADPGADDTQPKWRAPSYGGDTAIVAAYAVIDTALVAGTADMFSLTLLRYSMSGTVLTLAGTISKALGAAVSGTAPGWVANQPYAFTINEAALDAGDWVAVKYDETGTVAPLNIDIVLETAKGPQTLV